MLIKNLRKFSQGYLLKEHYSILEIRFGATQPEIRTAYLAMAKKFHPDTPTGDTEKFKQVAMAYEILNNSKSKQFQTITETDAESTETSQNQSEPFNRFEEEEKAYQEWREKRCWSGSSREQDFDQKGSEYYDPYSKQNERITFSQFKRDKHNKAYKEPPKRQARTSEANESFSFSGFLAFCLAVFGSSRI